MPSVRRCTAGAVGIVALLWAPPALADYTATHSGGAPGGIGNVFIEGDNQGDLLQIRRDSSGVLMHNRFSQGDAGFVSDLDFDSSLSGVQQLTNSAMSNITVVAGDGGDTLWAFVSNPNIDAQVTYQGDGGVDTVDVFNSSASARSVTLDGNQISGMLNRPIVYGSVENAVIRMFSSLPRDDTISVTSSPSAPTTIFANEGDDRLTLADGTTTGANFFGGPGTDTLDYSAWTNPVTTNLAATANFTANLDGFQTNPPSMSGAFGGGTVFFTDTSTNTFNYDLFLTGLPSSQITDSGIHSGAPGVNGPEIFDIGAGSQWSSQGASPFTTETGVHDPDVTEAALRDGNTYFNIHTATSDPEGGELRGRITLHPDTGYGGPATGVGGNGAFTVENVIGGGAPDDITATPAANRIEGGGGNDTLRGGPGADTLLGGADDDTLFAADGTVDAQLDCGAGSADVLNRDPAGIDPDGIVSGCESVSPPFTPALTGTDPPSGSNENNPKVKGTAPAGSTIDVFTNASCSGAPAVADASLASLTGAGIAVPVPDNSTTPFSVTATTSEGTSACSNSISYVEVTPSSGGGGGDGGGDGGGGDGGDGGDGSDGDGVVPPTDADPPDGQIRKVKVKDDDVKVTFGSDEPGSSFMCRLDKKPYRPCTSPKTYRNLDDGKHRVFVQTTDPAGNVDASPAKQRFHV